ncbi:MAG TPA: helix-turn-helix domain-containing protein [Candidatus Dormibacteraeota bacterium]|nr:helix-turn-helix domain-containing protein [Candidatus Dormibacteraeota bacterium]
MSTSSSVQLQASTDIVAELQEYGLTRNEARVLLFLAKTGPAKASEAARAVQINRTETYRTIRNLQRRGLVEATLERPVRLQSVPFDRCLNILIDERKARLRILEQRGEALRRQFAMTRVEPVTHEVERFQVVEGMLRIEQRLQNMFAQAQKSVMTVLSPSEMVRGDTAGLFDMLTHAAKGGLRVRVITAVIPPNLEIVEKLRQSVEIRHLDLKTKPIPRVSIVDDSEALFEISTADETHRTEEEVALWINSRAFVRNLQAYFDEMWNSATPSEARIEALRRGIPPDELKIFKGRNEVSGKLNEMTELANKSVEIWTTMRGIQVLADFHFNQLKDAKTRGVKIRIIAPITSENTEGARKLVPVSELRYSEALGPTGMIIVDQSGLMLYERLPDDNNPDVGADVGFWTNSNRFIETMSRAYDGMWKGVFTIYAPKRKPGQNR